MIHIEIKHHIDESSVRIIVKTEKTWRLFGVMIKKITYHYPQTRCFAEKTLLNVN